MQFKFCTDCKHCSFTLAVNYDPLPFLVTAEVPKRYWCSIKSKVKTNITAMNDCLAERDTGRCGREGRLFERKQPSE